jgi:hypothetical protein
MRPARAAPEGGTGAVLSLLAAAALPLSLPRVWLEACPPLCLKPLPSEPHPGAAGDMCPSLRPTLFPSPPARLPARHP